MRGYGEVNLLKLIAQNFDVPAGPVVSLAYPLYASIRAIETKSHLDDQQWLTYWILYSMLTLFELTFAKLLEWRIRDEPANQNQETANLTKKLDREIHSLRAQLEAAKYDVIKYCIGTLVSISAVGLAVLRILM